MGMGPGLFIFYNVLVVVVEVALYLAYERALIKNRVRLKKHKDLAAP